MPVAFTDAAAAGGVATHPPWHRFAESWHRRDPATYNEELPDAWRLADDFFTAQTDAEATFHLRNIAPFEYDAVAAVGLPAQSQAEGSAQLDRRLRVVELPGRGRGFVASEASAKPCGGRPVAKHRGPSLSTAARR